MSTTKWTCNINEKDYTVEIPNDHPGGYLYFDEVDDKVIYDGRDPTHFDPKRYWPLCGFSPKAARAAQEAEEKRKRGVLWEPPSPRNRAEKRRHLSLVRKGTHL